MLILPIEEACDGAKLAMSVFHPAQPGTELLKAGFVLDQAVIDRLKDIGVKTLYVDYPGLDDLDKFLVPAMSPARLQMFQQVKRTIAAVERTARPTVSFSDYYAATHELIITLMQSGPHAVYIDEMTARLPGDEVQHSTAVAHLSLTLGLRLEQYLVRQRSRLDPQHAREVVNLGVAGMLHDIGKARLPAPLRQRHSLKLPEEDGARRDWEAHARLGYEMLRGGIEPSATAAVLHHHQHYDGSGHPAVMQREGDPAPLAGEKIHVFARIVGAANLFDRLSTTPEGARRQNVQILHLLRTTHSKWIDPQVLKVMASVIPPFPPGVKVRLTDGAAAVVTELHHDHPYQPTVRRIHDGGVNGPAIDLAASGDLAIESIGGVNVAEMIPTPDHRVKPAA